MLSDLSHNILPVDMPALLDPTHSEEDPLAPLNFDDLLDIAREFEFTHTITHIWPCEEEPSTCQETGLEDILAAIVPTLNAEESPLPLPSSTLSVTHDPTVQVQKFDLHKSSSMCSAPANASISRDLIPLSKDNDQVRAEIQPQITSILRGWSPPNGSQFLDLDDGLALPQSPRDTWISPCLSTFLAPSCLLPANGPSQSPMMIPAIAAVQPQIAITEPKAPPVGAVDKTADDRRKKSVPFVHLPVQASTRTILAPVRPRSTLQTNSNVPSQSVIVPYTNTPQSRIRLSSTSATGNVITARYAKAPRGGIPPHIARTVTKANNLLVEKERKVMRDTFSSITIREGKKPSVLRRAAKVERETSTTVGGGGGNGRKLLTRRENDEKGGRAAKRVRS